MSYTIGQLVACERIQRDINEFFRTCPPREYMAAFEFIASDLNQEGIVQTVNPGKGKVRTVRVTYTPRQLESSVTENGSNPDCNVNNFIGNNYADYTIDTNENLKWGFSATAEELAYACVDPREYFLEKLFEGLDVLDRRMATERTADLMALQGRWASNVTQVNNELVVRTLTSAGLLNPTAMGDIDFAMMKSGFCGRSLIAAGTDLAAYYRATLAGCCSNQGIDVGKVLDLYGKAIAYDRRVEANWGVDGAVVIQAGAVQLLTYNRSPWIKDITGTGFASMGNEVYMVVVSPLGIPYDLMVSWNCGALSVSLTGTTKLVGMPNDMFAQGDFMQGVNYVAGIDVNNS